MAGRAIGVQRQRRTRQRVALSHDTHVFAVIEPSAFESHHVPRLRPSGQICQHRREITDRHVGGFFFQQTPRITGGEWQHPNGHPRGLALDDADQRGHQGGRCRVGHRQHKSRFGRGGVEPAGCERLLQLGQRLTHGCPQGQPDRRRLDPLATAHHQFIPHHVAQAPHRIAHGGLGDRQLVGGTREAALSHHLVENPQEVEVQRAEIQRRHGLFIIVVNINDSKYKLEHVKG